MAYYLIIKNKEVLGLLSSHDNEPLKADDDSWYRIKITQDEHSIYLQALKDNKEIYIDDDGKIQTRYKLEE
jgi:hypothetical protein